MSRMDGMSNGSVYERLGMCHREEVWSGGKSEVTDLKVVWPHGANGGE